MDEQRIESRNIELQQSRRAYIVFGDKYDDEFLKVPASRNNVMCYRCSVVTSFPGTLTRTSIIKQL
jgi:hypothetical protein